MNVSPKTVSRQEPRRLRTRAALIEAGVHLLAERPIDAIPVDDIIAHAGVAKGSFFNHFGDKDALAAAIADEIRARVEARVNEANRNVADPALRVVGGTVTFVKFALSEPQAARIMLRAYPHSLAFDHPLNAGLRADIVAGFTAGRFQAASEDAAIIYVTGIAQMLLAAVIDRRLEAAGAAAMTREVCMLLLAGLGVTPGDASAIVAAAV